MWYSGWRFPAACAQPQKDIQILGEELNIGARAIFKHECESPRSADPGYRWRREAERNSRRQLAQLLVEVRFDCLKLLGSGRALVPRLQGHDKERVVTRADITEQAEANNGRRVFDTRCVGQYFLDVYGGFRCSLQRGE
jgi:hypothetical protein